LTYCVISEEYRVPLILDKEQKRELDDEERNDDEDDDGQATVHGFARLHF
jgi:hypothetical protein